MVHIVVGGLCQSCGRYSMALISCRACGARVCTMCMQPSGFCKMCGGVKKGRSTG